MPAAGNRDSRTVSSPSRISSSERLDSSSSSISFLTLRRSMMASSVSGYPRRAVGMGVRLRAQAQESGVECVAIAVGTEPGDYPHREIREIRLAAEGFARVRVRKVYLDEGNGDGSQRVAQRH